uniref:Uncharacterized protein n=1 Tax=Solanum lycopersicum TaxID=4081 RepID=A0A3Q7ECG3_SOLLC
MKIIITPFFLLVLLVSRMKTNEAANLRPVRSPAPHSGSSPSPHPAGISPSPHPGSGVSGKNIVGPKKVSSAPPPLPPKSKQNNVPLVPRKSITRA